MLDLQVPDDNNDFWRYNTGFQLTPTVLRAGSHASPGIYHGAGLRFTNVTIPKDAIIEEAHLTPTCSAAKSDACKTRISAQAADNPDDFSGDDVGTASARWNNRTAARVDWDFLFSDAWVLDTEYSSPELKTVIQEIVNRAGWASGNAIVIFWNDWDDRSASATNRYKQAYPYNVAPGKAVKLHIEYTYEG